MNKEIDLRGLSCPQPVIKTKRELEEMKEGSLLVIVDNASAKENVLRLAKNLNCKAELYKEEKGDFYLKINKKGGS